jgi:hypothetical protein
VGGGLVETRQLMCASVLHLSVLRPSLWHPSLWHPVILSAACPPRSGEQAKSKDPYALRGILGRLKVFSHDRVLLTSERAVRIPLRSIHWLRS